MNWQMNTKMVGKEMLRIPDYYPRQELEIADKKYQQLKQSIEKDGYLEPIVWNQSTGNIVSGVLKYRIFLEESNGQEIEVWVIDATEQREKELCIYLNQHAGAFDEIKLAELIQSFPDAEAIMMAGIDGKEVDRLINQLDFHLDMEIPVEDDGFKIDEVVEHIQEPQTKLGDIWQLGRHFLMCGDTTNIVDVQQLMQGKQVDLVITDPPYNVAVESDNKNLEKSGRSSILNDDMTDEQFDMFLAKVFQSYQKVMAGHAAIYVFHPSSYQIEFENSMKLANIQVRSQCIWIKNYPSFGWSQYRWQHEPVFYAHLKGESPFWYGDRKQTTTWRDHSYLGEEASTIWEIARDSNNTYIHPTQKPLDLLAIPMRNSSKKGDTIADFFGGSGSTLLTAEQLGRICYTMELDPKFCDAIKQRFEAYTGIKPVLMQQLTTIDN
ncbi:DNA modification methylase [Listeria monocytogenes]|nr:DNA modification methylase [Listeria monocytogenes]